MWNQPFRVDRRRGRLRVLPVPLEDVRAARDDLAVRRDLHLDAGQRHSDRSEAVAVEAVEGQARRCLGEAIPLKDLDAELAPCHAERRIQRRAARHDVPEAAAELGVHAREENPSQRHRQTPRDPAQPREERALSLLLGAPLDRDEERPHRGGRDADHRDPALAEGSAHDRGLSTGGIHDRRARDEQAPEPGELLEHVRQRDEREQALLGTEREDVDGRKRVRQDIAVRQHRTLRISRRAGREDDLREIFGSDARLGHGRLRASLIGQKLHVEQRDRERRRTRSRLLRDDGRFRLRALGDLAHELLGGVHVERDQHRADAQQREHRDAVLGPVDAEHDHAVARTDARLGEEPSDAGHDVGEVAIGPGEGAEARLDDQRILPGELRGGCVQDVAQRLHPRPSPSSRAPEASPARPRGTAGSARTGWSPRQARQAARSSDVRASCRR